MSLLQYFSPLAAPTAAVILVSPPGTQPASPAVEVQRLNHRTSRKVPNHVYNLLPHQKSKCKKTATPDSLTTSPGCKNVHSFFEEFPFYDFLMLLLLKWWILSQDWPKEIQILPFSRTSKIVVFCNKGLLRGVTRHAKSTAQSPTDGGCPISGG